MPLRLFYSIGFYGRHVAYDSNRPCSRHSLTIAVARRELARADLHAELTKLLVHGFGTLTVKIHDHRITLVETTARLLEGKGEEA